MTAPPSDEGQRRVPPYVALVRIVAVLAMSAAAAFGIFIMLLGVDYLLWGALIFALALPPFLIMRLLERIAGPGPDEESDERPL